jgi:hypothetical protein
MGGIINYYHGEDGRAGRRSWSAAPDALTCTLEIGGNRHRTAAFDYGSDIGIDPAIREGDAVVYLRLDETCGIWVRAGDGGGPPLGAALERVEQNRAWMRRYEDAVAADGFPPGAWLRELARATGVPAAAGEEDGPAPGGEQPGTEASLFISYSSRNVLLARQIHDDLRRDARAQVWFDAARPGEAPAHPEALAEWLRGAVYASRGLVLLLTREAAESPWVRRETEWAAEQAAGGGDFRFIVLRLADVPLPEPARAAAVIDGEGLWKSNGINEELFAALLGREGRRAWRDRQPGLREAEAADPGVFRYADFQSDGGVAVDFTWKLRRRGLWSRARIVDWRLTYRAGEQTRQVRGAGEDAPVDLGIRPGDRVGSYVCRRRWGTSLADGVLLWMRTHDPAVTSDTVLDAYYQAYGGDAMPEVEERVMRVRGRDVYGRSLAELWLRTADGTLLPYSRVMRTSFTRAWMDAHPD